ncbi:hypothetical protein [Winogradskya humida]|uniref:ADP-ribosyltransferase exoenzyme n=1 Tax=Winogradskya humida TaxID=113566 RepID=A0ABQ3ZMJ5_9ACTN|nr:hypothetical protein [Actinoplanes humidus]GIE19802.1 hypothetical protein Ahu01nite_029040 [Actinoplanes humidus]
MRTGTDTSPIGRHTVGNALVLHARDKISPEAQSLALTVVEDDENDIVVLDLHDDLPVGIWESVAAALPRRRRGIRLVVCGTGQDTSVLAGQWISDRLGRPVVAPYGQLIRGTSGALFVHATEGSGWVRYSRGRPPSWEAKRYPQPVWDEAATDALPTSANGMVEPLPGGVWIRDTRDEAALREHWQWLASAMPCQPEAFTVVLGCPGTPPLALDDIARFWHELVDLGRDHARFIQYGPVALPEGESLGQALADLLGTPVVCFTGVPVGRPERPRMHTVAPDGRLGWQVYARELGYTPRARPTVAAEVPRVISYQAPEILGDEISPLIFRYADDAVVEILQSGLWVRPAEPPRHAERIRARTADPAVHAVVIEDGQPARMTRLRELADDLVARLDQATRERSTLQLASAVVVTSRNSAPAGGTIADGLTHSFTLSSLTETPAPATFAVATELPVSVPLPAALPSRRLAQAVPAIAVPDVTPNLAVVPPWAAPAPDLPTRAGTTPRISPRAAEAPVLPPSDAVRVLAAVEQVLLRPSAGPKHLSHGVPRLLRFQELPEGGPLGVTDPGELGEERAWLQDALRHEFDLAASSVSRILAEYPGYSAGSDTMADAVAVRLYLSAVGDGVDDALREGVSEGPQVPFARCVSGGLVRLPSHRGATMQVSDLCAADLRRVRERQVLRERGFTHALIDPPADLPGGVDVLIWSMTGRRTRLLEPDDEHRAESRVVFLPGTSFKVLDVVEPGEGTRGLLLLRELAADEPVADKVPFDDLALGALHRAIEQARTSGLRAQVGRLAAERFLAVPGVS